MDILIARDGKTYGPYTEEQLRDFLAKGSITVFDEAWTEGLPNWVKLHQLFDSLKRKQSEPRASDRKPDLPRPGPPTALGGLEAKDKPEVEGVGQGGEPAEGEALPASPSFEPSAQQSQDRTDFTFQLNAWLNRKGYHVGLPQKGVDTTGPATGATLSFLALKLAVLIFAKKNLHAEAHVEGVTATPEAVTKALSSLPASVEILAIRNDFMHGASAFFGLFADGLTSANLLASLEGIAETTLNLAEFALIASGRQTFFARPMVIHFDSGVYESHLGAMVRAGYLKKESKDKSHYRLAVSHAAFIDVPRRMVESSTPSGFFGKAMGLTNKPFSLNQLREVLAEPIQR